jgi:ApbE superfamily uncharacterized protein (UPF0280 family)
MISIESKELHKYRYTQKESVCTIVTDNHDTVETAVVAISSHRRQLENYIEANPEFLTSLEPLEIDEAPEVVLRMAEASQIAGVGPMAAVAGVLCDIAVEEMVKAGAHVAVVENGGEAFITSNQPIDIALQAGDTPLSRRVGFRIEKFPIGVATSSGKFSHAMSFGNSDAVTIFAVNAGLADAVATAVGNIIKSEDTVETGIRLALSFPGVSGAFIVYDEKVGFGGELPKLIKVEPDITEDPKTVQ